MQDAVKINDRLTHSMLERGAAGAGLLVFSAGCLIVGLVNPSATQLLPTCPLLSVTGFACPGWGMTRAFHAMFNGEFLTALDFNALLPFYVIGFAYFSISLFLIAVRGRGLPYRFITPVALFGFLIGSILFGVIRNIPSFPFTVLYP